MGANFGKEVPKDWGERVVHLLQEKMSYFACNDKQEDL